jgi:hypothetical protein
LQLGILSKTGILVPNKVFGSQGGVFTVESPTRESTRSSRVEHLPKAAVSKLSRVLQPLILSILGGHTLSVNWLALGGHRRLPQIGVRLALGEGGGSSPAASSSSPRSDSP